MLTKQIVYLDIRPKYLIQHVIRYVKIFQITIAALHIPIKISAD